MSTKWIYIAIGAISLTVVSTLLVFFLRETPIDIEGVPVFTGQVQIELEQYGSEPDWSSFVSVEDLEDGLITLTSENISSQVDMTVVGDYTVTYHVEDKDGNVSEHILYVHVFEEIVDITYPSGIYNISDMDPETIFTFYASAEKYLMETMSGGVPLVRNASYLVTSSRLELHTSRYIPALGYMEEVSTLNADDSTVIMGDGNYGNVGEYTLRTFTFFNILDFNQHHYNGYSDYIDKYVFDTLYDYDVIEGDLGFELVPSMAASYPVAIDENNGLASRWEITINDTMQWYYHEDTDPEFLNESPQTGIRAADFVESYKLAADLKWNTCNSSFYYINGYQDYLDSYTGMMDWDDVGMHVKEDDPYTIVIDTTEPIDQYTVMSMFSTIGSVPINRSLYNYYQAKVLHGEEVYNNYASSYDTIAYLGPYYIKEVTDDLITTKANPNYYDQSRVTYTGVDFYITSRDHVYGLYRDGLLDYSTMPNEAYDDIEDKSLLYPLGEGTTYRLMLNGFGSLENAQDYDPDFNYDPEPIVSSLAFKQALYYAVNRQALTEGDPSIIPAMTLQPGGMILNSKNARIYRLTEQGSSVLDVYNIDTFGYDESMAKAYFKEAIEEMIQEGYYEGIDQATSDNPYVITLELVSDSKSGEFYTMVETLIENLQEVLQDDTYHVKINIDVSYKGFPEIYYSYLLDANFDLGIGGISAGIMSGLSDLELYSSDNRSGFVMNYGIDTSEANILVDYYNQEGRHKKEMWSFDAIASGLYKDNVIVEGEEFIEPEILVTATSTSLRFDIEDLPDYVNIKSYKMYVINDDLDYEEMGQWAMVNEITFPIVVNGLDTFRQTSDLDNNYYYEGYYLIELVYTLAFDEDETEFMITLECRTLGAMDIVNKTITSSSILYDVLVNEDNGRVIDTIEVYQEVDGEWVLNTTVYVETILSQIEVNNLESDTKYAIKVTFSDGLIYYYKENTLEE
jgi:hypothetical protein